MLMKRFLLSVFKTAVLLNIYVETDKKKIRSTGSLKEHHLFRMKIFCNIINVNFKQLNNIFFAK